MENHVIITYEDLVKKINSYMSKEDVDLVKKYYEKALVIYDGMKRKTGEEYIYHSIEVSYILADLEMDPVTIGCSLIHEAITLDKCTYDEIKDEFGEESAVILLCASKISGLKRTFKKENNTERYRKIIVGLSENPKTLFIKLADRLSNLRTVYVHDEEHTREIIDETMNILIPLAHRLGLKKIMSELEDLCLKYTKPKEYNGILEKINSSREELEKDLETMKQEIVDLLNEHNIKFEILSRVKSVRGIYNKLAIGKKWDDIYDLLGIRVLVDKVEECYLVIGIIHSKFRPIPKRFKDFIANPKSNMYQSLHTTVFGWNNKKYEVQVRTHEMDEIAETGLASHWSYKEKTNNKAKSSMDQKLETFRSLIKVNDIENNNEFFKNINAELTNKDIYVFTPKGDVIELPYGSTPIDFAYKIHSEVGNTVIGALVNRKLVKLDYKLEDGDIVELNTRKGASPSKNWLKFVKTETAKGRIKSYFYKKEKEKMILSGKELLETEIRKKKLDINNIMSEENVNKLLEELKLESLEDLYFNIAILKYLPLTIIKKLLPKEEKKFDIKNTLQKSEKSSGVLVEGEDNILTSFASCCSPVYGEEIVGYVTKGEGIKIHSKSCKNALNRTERIVDVEWDATNNSKYKTSLDIFITDDNVDLSSIVILATKLNANIESINLNSKDKEKYYNVSARVKNITDLNKFMTELLNIKFITKVERSDR